MKVALLHNVRPVSIAEGLPDDAFEEYDTAETIASVARALSRLPIHVEPIEADRTLPWRLEAGGYDFVFNVAEGRGRRCREAIPAAVCELLGIPFTGSDMLTLAIALDKAAARRLVSPEVPVACAMLLESAPVEADLQRLTYPVIVKPNDEGSSKGLGGQPVAASASEASCRVRWLHETYHCPVLIEEFLSGAEVTVGVAGNHVDTRILGMMEIAPAEPAPAWAYSLDVKRDWRRRVRYHMPPRLDVSTIETIKHYALTAYRLLGCRDLARLDFRLDANGTPHFLECNPLPGLHPESGDIAILSQRTLPYENLVQGVLLDAARRWNVSLPLNGHA
jgi:D-alanine-D-alanine ligase